MISLTKQISFERISIAIILTTTLIAVSTPTPLSAQTSNADFIGDADAGEKIFKKCKACHKVGDNAKNATGPVLNNVFGRSAGSFKGYKYGKSMKKAGQNGLVWNEEEVFNYIANPKKYLRKILENKKAKAKMKFKLKKASERKNVIAYLKRFSKSAEVESAKEAMKSEITKTSSKTTVYEALNTEICLQNKQTKTLLFTVESNSGQRLVKMVEENATLCVSSDENSSGTVGVFENEDALEGCSRLAKSGKTQTLIAYASFDNCKWGDHAD